MPYKLIIGFTNNDGSRESFTYDPQDDHDLDLANHAQTILGSTKNAFEMKLGWEDLDEEVIEEELEDTDERKDTVENEDEAEARQKKIESDQLQSMLETEAADPVLQG